jgi:hypothetical protein
MSLSIVLFVILWFADFGYRFGIYKLSLSHILKTLSLLHSDIHNTRHLVQYKSSKKWSVVRLWTPLKTGDELRCSANGTRRVILVTNPVINLEWGKDRKMLMTSETYPWSFVT